MSTPASQTPALPVDRASLAMLRVLQEDGRISVSALAKRVGISRASAHARIAAMLETGVIRRFTVDVDARRLGLGTSALVAIRADQQAQSGVAPSVLRELPYVEYGAFITGPYDVVVLARVPDVETLRNEILWPLQRQEFVRSTQTLVVLQEFVDRSVTVPDA
jgi:DNA-binding Lrp family transcriptional regulator